MAFHFQKWIGEVVVNVENTWHLSSTMLALLATLLLLSILLIALGGWMIVRAFLASRQENRETEALEDFERNFVELEKLARQGDLNSYQLAELVQTWFAVLQRRVQIDGPCRRQLREIRQSVQQFVREFCVESRDG